MYGKTPDCLITMCGAGLKSDPHWETHVNSGYNDFLDIAIGEHGPYQDADLYMAAVMKKLKSAGIDLAALMHDSRKI